MKKSVRKSTKTPHLRHQISLSPRERCNLLLYLGFAAQTEINLFCIFDVVDWNNCGLIRRLTQITITTLAIAGLNAGPLSCSNENLEILFSVDGGKWENPKKKTSEQGQEPTTNSTHLGHQWPKLYKSGNYTMVPSLHQFDDTFFELGIL